MSIYGSRLWISDLNEIVNILPELESLSKKSILVTGGSGLICSAVIDVLIKWNISHKSKINIIAAGRNIDKLKGRFWPYCNECWFKIVSYDALSLKNDLDFFCDYIIHGASNASPDIIMQEPVETMISNFIGVKQLLDYTKRIGAKRVLYISTSEVYGKKEHDRPSSDNEYGGIDILNPRSSYSVGKCAAETLCVSYYDEYNVDSVIVRPGHIYGPTATEHDYRVSSAWAYAVARGEDIIMKSNGNQIRSYCYCLDCASAILKVLLKGKTANAYNISNPNSVITIKQMAEILTKSAGVELKVEVPSESERKRFNPMKNSSLDSSKLLNLGWRGLYDAERGFKHTIAIMKENLHI